MLGNWEDLDPSPETTADRPRTRDSRGADERAEGVWIARHPAETVRKLLRVLGRIGIAVLCTTLFGACSQDDAGEDAGGKASPTTSAAPTTSSVPTPDAILGASAPSGYSVEPVDPEVEEETRQRFGEDPDASEIIDEIHMREVSRGGAPVATVLLFALSEGGSSADRAGILDGFEEAAGGPGEPVSVGAKTATVFDEEGVLTLITTTNAYALMVIGQDRDEIMAVAQGAAAAM